MSDSDNVLQLELGSIVHLWNGKKYRVMSRDIRHLYASHADSQLCMRRDREPPILFHYQYLEEIIEGDSEIGWDLEDKEENFVEEKIETIINQEENREAEDFFENIFG